jgi:hypothetical protein
VGGCGGSTSYGAEIRAGAFYQQGLWAGAERASIGRGGGGGGAGGGVPALLPRGWTGAFCYVALAAFRCPCLDGALTGALDTASRADAM